MKRLRAEIRGQVRMLTKLNSRLMGKSDLRPVRETITMIRDDLLSILVDEKIRREDRITTLLDNILFEKLTDLESEDVIERHTSENINWEVEK